MVTLCLWYIITCMLKINALGINIMLLCHAVFGILLFYCQNVKLTDAATILNSLLVNMMADNQTFLSTMSDDDDHTGYTPKQKYEIINANEGVRPVGNRKNWNSLRNPVTYESNVGWLCIII